ncbi:glutamate--tRNA ligase, cytoplasmic [Tanacetum coccineum]
MLSPFKKHMISSNLHCCTTITKHFHSYQGKLPRKTAKENCISNPGSALGQSESTNAVNSSLRNVALSEEEAKDFQALKRRGSVLDNDIGSGGPLRRTRQKANLLTQRDKRELGYTALQQLDHIALHFDLPLFGGFGRLDHDAAFFTFKDILLLVTDSKKLQVVRARKRPEVDLPHAEMGKVRLRFAPEPSGYLHIGHLKAVLLNLYFALKYHGNQILRFDDTNPAKENNEYVDSIIKDFKTMGINFEEVTFTSNYFPQLMDMARERMDGIDSNCRNNRLAENIRLWNEMLVGSDRGLQCCLRGKLNMQDPNKSLRDPVYYPNAASQNRSKYHDRNAQYFRIQETMELRKVHIYEYSRLNMVFTPLSKRKLLWFVENGIVDGWDDARFPTVQGMLRRGLKMDALIQFILEQVRSS